MTACLGCVAGMCAHCCASLACCHRSIIGLGCSSPRARTHLLPGLPHLQLPTAPCVAHAAGRASSVTAQLSDRDTASLQAQLVTKGSSGAGMLVPSYHRALSPYDTLDVTAVLGGRPALSVASGRRLGPYQTASLTATYSADAGLSLQVGLTATNGNSQLGQVWWC